MTVYEFINFSVYDIPPIQAFLGMIHVLPQIDIFWGDAARIMG